MFHKVKGVYPLPCMRLSVVFANGTTKTYEVTPLLERIDAFRVLEDERVFNGVEVDVGGYGIVWNDDVDLSCDELWENGVIEETPFDGLMSFAEATTTTLSDEAFDRFCTILDAPMPAATRDLLERKPIWPRAALPSLSGYLRDVT